MKLFLLCILFIPIIYLALRQKKWHLYLLVAFMGILPEQFAVELHDKLPLVSGTRVLIMVLLFFWLYDRWKRKQFSCPVSLMVFFVINVIISIINLRYGFGEIKRIFLLIFERVLLIMMLMDTIESREEFDRCIDFMILGCCAISIMGIMQTVFEYDIASVLHLTKTFASATLTPRMGMIRAYGTMNAISFGCYCAFMILPIYYRIEKTGLLRYAVAFALAFMALICTFSRSAWLAIGAILLLLLLIRRGKMIRKILPSSVVILALCMTLCVVQPKLGNAFLETGKSSLNTILSILPEMPRVYESESSELSEAHELGFEISQDFGLNGGDPSYSRMAQWTAVEYMIKDGEGLFGYGYNAFPEGRLRFFFDRWAGKWEVATFLDVGLVALFTESGLIGAASYLGLLAFLWLKVFCRRARMAEFDFCRVMLYLIPLYLLLNFLASFLFADAVWLIWALCYCNIRICNLDDAVEDVSSLKYVHFNR